MLRTSCSALVVALCLWSNPLRADFVISFDPNTNIAPGSTGFVNVYISSTVPGQTLSQTSFEFALSTTGGTRLEFMNSPAPASDPTFSNPTYVFAGNSFSESNGIPLGSAQTASGPNDRFAGGDFPADFFSFAFVDATPKLIASVPITTITGLPPGDGDTFTISLVPASGSGLAGQTGFFDALGAGQPFTSGIGTITITGITASPEPSALILVGTGVGLSWLVGRRRGRAVPTTP